MVRSCVVAAGAVGYLALLSIACFAAVPGTLPIAPFAAEYSVYAQGIALGTGTISLRAAGPQRYRMSASIAPNALAMLFVSAQLSEQAEGEFTAAGPRPLSYHAERGSTSKPRSTALSFDWAGGIVDARYNDEHQRLALTARAVDPLSLYLQVMWDLQRGELAEHYTLIDRTRSRDYRVTAQGGERLSTPLGELATLRFARSRAGSSRAVIFWFAPALDYLPVRIVQRKGDSEQLRLEIATLRR